MLFGDTLKKLRTEKGLTQKDLGKIINVSDRVIGYYEANDRFPKDEKTLTKIAIFFGVTTDYLLGLTEDPKGYWNKILDPESTPESLADEFALEMKDKVGSEKILEYRDYLTTQFMMLRDMYESGENDNDDDFNMKPLNMDSIINLPIVGTIRAGEPILAIENIEGYYPTDKQLLCPGHEYFYLRVKGDSMDKEFPEGSLILIKRQPVAENGEIAVVLINGHEATVKKFYKTNTTVTLIPQSNNVSHQPKIIDLTQEKVEIIGKVKMAVKTY